MFLEGYCGVILQLILPFTTAHCSDLIFNKMQIYSLINLNNSELEMHETSRNSCHQSAADCQAEHLHITWEMQHHMTTDQNKQSTQHLKYMIIWSVLSKSMFLAWEFAKYHAIYNLPFLCKIVRSIYENLAGLNNVACKPLSAVAISSGSLLFNTCMETAMRCHWLKCWQSVASSQLCTSTEDAETPVSYQTTCKREAVAQIGRLKKAIQKASWETVFTLEG